jgi:hypothetical protein
MPILPSLPFRSSVLECLPATRSASGQRCSRAEG